MAHLYSFHNTPNIERVITEVVLDGDGVRPDCIVLATKTSAVILLSQEFLDRFDPYDEIRLDEDNLGPGWGLESIRAIELNGRVQFRGPNEVDPGADLLGYRGTYTTVDRLNCLRKDYQKAKEWAENNKVGVHIW